MSFLQALSNRKLFEAYLAVRKVHHQTVGSQDIEFFEEGSWWTATFLSDGRFTSLKEGVSPVSYGLFG